MSESMHGSSKVPSTNELINQGSANTEMQYNYIDSLNIDTYDQSCIYKLEARVVHLKPSAFKSQLEKSIQCRKNQLKPFEEQKMQFERNKDRLDSQKLQFERQKQKFFEQLQTQKLALQCVKVIFALVGLFLTACGIYAYILQAPQFAVSAGGSIQMGTVDPKLQGIGGTIIATLGFGVGLASIGFCCWSCCKGKI